MDSYCCRCGNRMSTAEAAAYGSRCEDCSALAIDPVRHYRGVLVAVQTTRNIPAPETKICCRCEKLLPLGDFAVAMAHGKMRVRSWCLDCCAAYHRQHKQRQRARC